MSNEMFVKGNTRKNAWYLLIITYYECLHILYYPYNSINTTALKQHWLLKKDRIY